MRTRCVFALAAGLACIAFLAANAAAMYHPTVGRFMQRDPVGYEGGADLYQYLGGSPALSTDPSGLLEGTVLTSISLQFKEQEQVDKTARKKGVRGVTPKPASNDLQVASGVEPCANAAHTGKDGGNCWKCKWTPMLAITIEVSRAVPMEEALIAELSKDPAKAREAAAKMVDPVVTLDTGESQTNGPYDKYRDLPVTQEATVAHESVHAEQWESHAQWAWSTAYGPKNPCRDVPEEQARIECRRLAEVVRDEWVSRFRSGYMSRAEREGPAYDAGAASLKKTAEKLLQAIGDSPL